MANLSNINNKLLVGTSGEVRIGDTSTVTDVKLRIKQLANQWPMQIVSSYAYGLSIDTSSGTDGSAGSLQIYNNSGGGFVVRNDSKVGIGTASPYTNLEIKGSGADSIVRLYAGGGTANIRTWEMRAVGVAGEGLLFRQVNDANTVYTNRMIIDTGGNVGIGTISPGTLHGVSYGTTKLHVDGGTDRGQMIIEGDSFAGIVLSDNGATANQRVFATSVDDTKYTIKPLADNGTSTAGGVAVTVLHGGNVGIGVTGPGSKLEVDVGNGDFYSDTNKAIRAYDLTGGVYTAMGRRGIYTAGSHQEFRSATTYMAFYTGTDGNPANATQKMRIDSGGSIMIGGVAPSGTPTADYRSLEIGRQGNTITGAPWKSNLYFSTNATITAGSTTFTARYLNELPMLHTMEDGVFAWSNAVLPTAVGNTVVWNEKMRITAGGNLGIGMTSPTASLGIKANFAVNGSYTTSGWSRYLVLDAANSGGGGIIWTKQSSTYNRGIMVNQGSFFVGRSTANDASAAWLTDLSIDAAGVSTFEKAVNIAGTLTLDQGSLLNGIINTPASLRINIDSNNNNVGEVFIVGHNQTNIDNNNVLFKVEENGTSTFYGNILVSSTSNGIFLGGTGSSSVLKKFVGNQGGGGAVWTPTVTTSQATSPTITSSSGYYQQVGNVVTVSFEFTMGSNHASGAGTVIISNLPIAIADTNHVSGCGSINDLGKTINVRHYTASNQIGMNFYDGNYCGTQYRTVGTVTYWAAT